MTDTFIIRCQISIHSSKRTFLNIFGSSEFHRFTISHFDYSCIAATLEFPNWPLSHDSTYAWCVKRDACSPKSSKIERATPHARHAWCVIHRSGSGQHASREPTMTSFYGFSRVPPPPPKILACDPGTTTSNIGPIAKRCLGIYRFSCEIDF